MKKLLVGVALACLAVFLAVGGAGASTPGVDVRLTNDATGYASVYTLATGNAYTDQTLDECSIAKGRQNEPAVGVDPRNTSVLLGSSNDYCGVYNRGVSAGVGRVTDASTNPNYEQYDDRSVPFAGDYLWVTSLGNFAYAAWTDWRNTVQGTDPRETPEDEDAGTADVRQCRNVLTQTDKKGNIVKSWSGDLCPHDGGIDQNIYGDSVAVDG